MRVSSLALGLRHTCATAKAGNYDMLYCWGSNNSGQLGIGNYTQMNRPTLVTGSDVAYGPTAGYEHTCVLLVEGTAKCWGLNEKGQLGTGNTSSSNVPVLVADDELTSYSKLSAGNMFTCGITSDGNVRCWGDNTYGQIGNGDPGNNALKPVQVELPGGAYAQDICTGYGHTCVLTEGGPAFCWGANDMGQLGNGVTIQASTPVLLKVPSQVVFTSIHCGSAHTCAIDPNGTMYCWGNNMYGQLGTGGSSIFKTPQPVIWGGGTF